MSTEQRAIARAEAVRQYAAAFDSWAEQEQLLMLEGREIEAAGCRVMAQRIARSWLAEQDDPEPER